MIDTLHNLLALFSGSSITNWRAFSRKVRKKGGKLLATLPNFRDSILIAGCQRSGATLLSQVIMSSRSIEDYRQSSDGELDGAIILCGKRDIENPSGRFCFQTTYLNERYQEYFEHVGKFKMIFIIRNPEDVVTYMCRRRGGRVFRSGFELNELYKTCGTDQLSAERRRRWGIQEGGRGISRLEKACLAYVGKTSQLFKLQEKIEKDLLVVDFDEMMESRFTVMPRIYAFLGLPEDEIVYHPIRPDGMYKARLLSHQERIRIREICGDTYDRARRWVG
jgi:hypothetical protein